ncbi:hypothetical protein SSPO_030180 [Streptomyces antimycoticus]|uniref:Mur ligase N-terminal catalytic domain-containing protein n=1 Tax=Streptomyces antimycoticus TaxID=68175 RepID=A0A499UJ33_9ACTN|nr:hypothetical protein SSPO_030180 [Streptomyces antimycoticus]
MAPAGTASDALDRPHFIGIGGAGMSGVAKVLAMRGARVSGSDTKDSPIVGALRELGATVHIGHAAGNIAADATSVVVSSAIRADNLELVTARERGIPVVHRSDALAALMDGARPIAVAGTHGKTTTTSMLAVSLRTLGLDPSYVIGGDLDAPAPAPATATARSSSPRPTRVTAASTSTRPRWRSSSMWSSTTTPTTPRWTRSTHRSRPSSAGSGPAARW